MVRANAAGLNCQTFFRPGVRVTDDLQRARYFNLATFRRSGAAVETPVWFATDGDVHYVFSAGEAGKVKRIRVSDRARVAVCGPRGELKGPWLDARARLVREPSEVARAYRALRGKYGVVMWLTDLLSRVAGRYHKRQLIAVTLAGEEAASA